MNISAKRFEKIAILHVSGPLTVSDVGQFDADLPTQCKSSSTVIIDLTTASVDSQAQAALLAFRDKNQKAKPRFLFVGLADAADLVSALDSVGTTEADRIIQIFAKELELKKLKSRLAKEKERASQLLQGVLGSSNEGSISLEEHHRSLTRLRDKNKKLKHLFKVWEGEGAALKKQRVREAQPVDAEVKAAVEEAVKKLLGLIKSEKVLEG